MRPSQHSRPAFAKPWSVLFLLLACEVWKLPAQQPAFITNGLVAHYSFDGSVADISGSGANVAKVEGVIQYTPGIRDSAALLAAKTRLEGAGIQLAGRSHTISFWYNRNHAPGDLGAVYGGGLNIGSESTSGRRLGIGFAYAGHPRLLRYGFWNSDLDVRGIPFGEHGWEHVAFTFEHSDRAMSIYRNGRRVALGTASLEFSGTSHFVIAGGDTPTSFDELRIHARALSADEIEQMYRYDTLPAVTSPTALRVVVGGPWTWAEARFDAQRLGGWLAAINDSEENDVIAGLISEAVSQSGFWIGAVDESAEGGWRWITGEPWNYSNWIPGQPDNGLGRQHYALVERRADAHHGGWDDNYADHRLSGYILEYPLEAGLRRATAFAKMVNGFVVGVAVNDGGDGYSEPPVVLLVGGGGVGAKAQAVVVGGRVTAITITDAGSGYTTSPAVRVASPALSPTINVEVSRVRVELRLRLGKRYQLESSLDLAAWSPARAPFVAEEELWRGEFDVDSGGRFFRLSELP